jgi:AcrR family transcriptional regulator
LLATRRSVWLIGKMTHATATETGWRGSRELWLSAAYETLLDAGVEAVRIMPLAKKLNLSRTSFYWFFSDRQEVLDALIELWRDKNTGNLIRQTKAYADSVAEAILNVFDCWLDRSLFDSPFEYAVRSWALQSADIASEIVAADDRRIAAVTQMFIRHGYAELEADVRARTIYLTQIGYISMNTKENISVRMRRIPKYVEIFTGKVPLPHELDRFFARHGYRGKVDTASRPHRAVG